MVSAYGRTVLWKRVDHTEPNQVRVLFASIEDGQDGQLDILVNDVWGGDALADWRVPFWEHSLENDLLMQQRAVHSHMITSHFGAPLMAKRESGIILN